MNRRSFFHFLSGIAAALGFPAAIASSGNATLPETFLGSNEDADFFDGFVEVQEQQRLAALGSVHADSHIVYPNKTQALREKYPWVYLHRSGADACGRIAFLLTHKPSPFQRLQSRGIAHTNGLPMTPFERVRCDACNKLIENPLSSDVISVIEAA